METSQRVLFLEALASAPVLRTPHWHVCVPFVLPPTRDHPERDPVRHATRVLQGHLNVGPEPKLYALGTQAIHVATLARRELGMASPIERVTTPHDLTKELESQDVAALEALFLECKALYADNSERLPLGCGKVVVMGPRIVGVNDSTTETGKAEKALVTSGLHVYRPFGDRFHIYEESDNGVARFMKFTPYERDQLEALHRVPCLKSFQNVGIITFGYNQKLYVHALTDELQKLGYTPGPRFHLPHLTKLAPHHFQLLANALDGQGGQRVAQDVYDALAEHRVSTATANLQKIDTTKKRQLSEHGRKQIADAARSRVLSDSAAAHSSAMGSAVMADPQAKAYLHEQRAKARAAGGKMNCDSMIRVHELLGALGDDKYTARIIGYNLCMGTAEYRKFVSMLKGSEEADQYILNEKRAAEAHMSARGEELRWSQAPDAFEALGRGEGKMLYEQCSASLVVMELKDLGLPLTQLFFLAGHDHSDVVCIKNAEKRASASLTLEEYASVTERPDVFGKIMLALGGDLFRVARWMVSRADVRADVRQVELFLLHLARLYEIPVAGQSPTHASWETVNREAHENPLRGGYQTWQARHAKKRRVDLATKDI